MGWVDGEVDGVAIKRCSIVGNSEWEKVFEQFMEYELASLKDRENMGTGFGDPFNDTSDVSLSNAYLSSGALRNSQTAAVPAQSGGNPVPVMTSNSSPSPWVVGRDCMYSSAYDGFYAFDKNSVTRWQTPDATPYPHWLSIGSPSVSMTLQGVKLTAYAYHRDTYAPKDMRLQVSDNNSSWTTVLTRSGLSWNPGETKTFNFSANVTCKYVRMYATSGTDTYWVHTCAIRKLELIGADIPYQPAIIHSATVTLDSYTPTETLEAVKVKLWLENLDNSAAISCGNSGNDKIEAYLSYNSNSSFTPALNFPVENIRPVYSGSNIYIFTSEEIDVSTQSISGLGLRIKSFARSVAPNFKLHGALVVGRPIVEE